MFLGIVVLPRPAGVDGAMVMRTSMDFDAGLEKPLSADDALVTRSSEFGMADLA